MNVAIYARTNTNFTKTLNRQIVELKDYATKHGYTVTKIYQELHDGTTLIRPQLKQVLKDAKDGQFSALLVTAPARISRTVMDFWIVKTELAKYGARLLFSELPADSSPAGSLMLSVSLIMDEYYAKQISYKIKTGIARARLKKMAVAKRPIAIST